MLTITRDDGYEFSTDPGRIDIDRVHQWLSTDAYWAMGRPRDVFVRVVAASTVVGVYRPGDGEQVAFARAVTDGALFAWLCDVYVDRSERGRGLGTWMVGSLRDELVERGVRRILLNTADAHGVYAKHGFTPLAEPDQWMVYDRGNSAVTPITRKD
ncbi:GNAT family N-acetyltransferase [Micromonospora sp. NPDC049679]|uniref:GNAT family N-acetyltransferase n=1 Tax=Micromonospora sp. NPDC049679 TaxID=3155920 RepID=UPI00340C89F2